MTTEQIAQVITERLFELGSGPWPCERIQFMAHWSDTKEHGQGGMCKEAFERWLRRELKSAQRESLETLKRDLDRARWLLRRTNEHGRLYGSVVWTDITAFLERTDEEGYKPGDKLTITGCGEPFDGTRVVSEVHEEPVHVYDRHCMCPKCAQNWSSDGA